MGRRAEIRIPLDIADVDVVEMREGKGGKLTVTVKNRATTTECGVCGRTIECKHGCGAAITLRHLPILGRETYIRVRPKRGKCEECLTSPTTTQKASWYKQRSPHTKAYDSYLVKQLRGSTVADVSEKEQVGYDAVLGALQREVPVDVEWEKIKQLGTVGIDEVATKKGHKGYRAIITARDDDGTIHVLGVLKDRKKRQ